MLKRTWIIIIGVLAVGLLASACGSGDLAKDLTPVPNLKPPEQTPTLIDKLEGDAMLPAGDGQAAAPDTDADAEPPADEEPTDQEPAGEGDADQAAPDPQLVADGEQLFTSKGCIGCHMAEGGAFPTLTGMGARAAEHAQDGQTPAEYLHESIVNPGAYVVEGYPNIMQPNGGQELTDDEINALVAYMLTK